MGEVKPAITTFSETALWVAVHRALETERPDAVFRDPYARRLAGERGEEIVGALRDARRHEWVWTARTYLFDQYISEQVAQGTDMVINLAAGLDSRPYRMNLPSSLHWVEVDLPELMAYKEDILRNERPRCPLERISLDLRDLEARRALFTRLGHESKKAMIVTEGLLIYLTPQQVSELACDLAGPPSFQSWAFELVSPGLLRMLQKQMGPQMSAEVPRLQFGPPEGPAFFEPFGWRVADARSILKTAAKLKRLPLFLRLMAKLPASNGRQGNRPWSGICLLSKA